LWFVFDLVVVLGFFCLGFSALSMLPKVTFHVAKRDVWVAGFMVRVLISEGDGQLASAPSSAMLLGMIFD